MAAALAKTQRHSTTVMRAFESSGAVDGAYGAAAAAATAEPKPLFPEYEVRGIRFSVSDPASIRKQSVVAIDEPNLYSKGLPTASAPNDLKMGSVDRRMRCSTCRHGVNYCMGHSGHIELAVPVCHWLLIDSVENSEVGLLFLQSSAHRPHQA